jgi:hypothetical protein
MADVDIFLYPPGDAPFDIILCDPLNVCQPAVIVTPPLGGGPGHPMWRGPKVERPRYDACGPCPIHPPGVCTRMQRRNGECYCIPVAPVAMSLLRDLVGRYGVVEGNKVYLAMRDNAQGPFAPGNKYDVSAPAEPQTGARAAYGGKRRPQEH